ncbi:MAG: VOC family protein [Rhizomicrobium sp.]
MRQTAFGQRLALFLRLIGSPISLANIVPSLENGMPVHGFNHLNIRTPDFRRTVEFLRDALGMRVSPVPGLDSTEKAAWILDDSGTAVLHLASADVPYSKNEVLPDPPPRGSGAIQHVALTCTDIEAMRAKLRALNLEFRENNPEKGVRQIFVKDPSDITLELNFRDV